MSEPTRDDLRMISLNSYDDFARTAAKKILELLEEKESLQKQLRQANECAAHWACLHHAEEARFQRQNREIGRLHAALAWVKRRFEEEWTYELGVGEVVDEIIQRFEQGEGDPDEAGQGS
ncbi:hypothetical protein [Paenibacillus ihumii]|uniref:hypothetical protein n=1 Tax=Paenibacillus ihumii TaxID=687436 RepID=UPI0006D774AE|nr:hypothetical protein [Paenibacillus ihumii]